MECDQWITYKSRVSITRNSACSLHLVNLGAINMHNMILKCLVLEHPLRIIILGA